MKITSIAAQVKNPDRVSIGVDGKYSFSLEISQLVELGIKIGIEVTESDLERYKKASDYGKLYYNALVYSMSRPHSVREVELYLRKKSQDPEMITGVIEKLIDKRYVNDDNFARWWVENRMLKKGVSTRRLKQELLNKGVSSESITSAIESVDRDEKEEIMKMLKRKINKYEPEKLKAYLMRQGFRYSDIVEAFEDYDSSDSD